MKLRFTITLACAVAVLAAPAVARGELVVGAADNRPESSPEQAERFYDTMVEVGLTENRLAITWNAQQPTVIDRQEALDQAVELAAARGIRLTFSVFARPANSISSNPVNGTRFVAFLAHLARTYPTVRDFIVGNEPNKPLGWLPQFDARRRAVACTSYAGLLAASYDALKGVDQRITVIGLAVGARGNDNPAAGTNKSISPVRCIRDVGRAYRASRRTRPLMDEISVHPYPQNFSDSLETGYRWPNAGVPNVARIKQAVWDAFNRTAQPTFSEPGAPLRTMKLRLNEVGWQVAIPPASQSAYFGRENVAVTDDGNQAAIYGNVIPYLACDASVRSLLFFNMVDEPDLDRWQAGLMRADGTRRPSYGAVKSALARGLAKCNRRPVAWRHSTVVVGASAKFGERRRSARDTNWTFVASSEEASLFSAAMYRLKGRGLSAKGRKQLLAAVGVKRTPKAVFTARGKVRAHLGTFVRFKRKRLAPGYYVFAIRLRAEMNPTRATALVGRPFAVGTPSARTK